MMLFTQCDNINGPLFNIWMTSDINGSALSNHPMKLILLIHIMLKHITSYIDINSF